MTQVLCIIVWHMYCVLYYDTGIVYYIMTQVLCTILWHRYFVIYYETCIFVLYYDTGIFYYIMTQVFRLYSLLQGTAYPSETTEFTPDLKSSCCSIYHKILDSKYKVKIPVMYSQNKTWACQRGHEKPQYLQLLLFLFRHCFVFFL
jgi:hypothetical protein